MHAHHPGVVDVEQVDEYYGGKVEATGFRVAEMAVEAGLPPGVLNVVTGSGAEAVPDASGAH